MLALLENAARSGHVHRCFQVLENIEYRKVRCIEDLEPIARLRQKAYLQHEIFKSADGSGMDESDLHPDVHVFGVHYREKLVASVRFDVLTPESRDSNCMHYFGDILTPLLDQGFRFLDPTRFVVDPELDGSVAAIPHITLRLSVLAMIHFDCDFGLCMLRRSHVGFYRKFFRATQICPLRPFANTREAYGLFSIPRRAEERIIRQYPPFGSMAAERRLLFDGVPLGRPAADCVRPTAELAFRLQGGAVDRLQPTG